MIQKDEFAWKGAELAICAVLQLCLVFIAYRIDKSKKIVSITESSVAICFGLVVAFHYEYNFKNEK